ncbi:hypothetical protein AGOR_G00218000 [Albula goreensis]|uniref:Cystatin domain-containing protein n=1 Tax=Albula goreensis TaxID=1534307 RepID=A0A8T3CMV9_9TELE|nr:hypothetical protein AGOR_G00218000 [Albula goreensis]
MTGSVRFVGTLLSLSLLAVAAPPGTVTDADPQDPEVQACASFFLESFNTMVGNPHLYVITKFYSVKRTEIGGGQYDIDVQLTPTQCKKGDNLDLSSCKPLASPGNQVSRCQFVVLTAPWKQQRTLIQSACVM